MNLHGIVTAAAAPGNEARQLAAPSLDPTEQPRLRHAVAGVLGLVAAMCWAWHGAGPLQLLLLAALIALVAEGERRLERATGGPVREAMLFASASIQVALLTAGLNAGAPWFWVAPLLLMLRLADASMVLGKGALIAVTLAASTGNLLAARAWVGLPGAVPVDIGVAVVPLGSLFVSGAIYPALAGLLYFGSRRGAAARRQLEATAADLDATRETLEQLEGRLRRREREAGEELQRHTRALSERNRYLSVLNSISFVLAEPRQDAGAVERATRMVARLVGVRAAQTFTGEAPGGALDLFVTVAPEDIYAPRLPESVLRSVAATGRPLASGGHGDGSPHPDLGEPYHVVPLVARGRTIGALGLIGGSAEIDDDRRQLLLLVGRELGVALEGARLYTDALERARREAFLTEVARLLNAAGPGDRAIPDVLDAVLGQVDAREALLVSAPQGSRDVVVAGSAVLPGVQPVLETVAKALTQLASDRVLPMVLGRGGEAPLSEEFRARGLSTIVVAPIFAERGDSGLAPDPARAVTADEEAIRAVQGPVLTGALIVAAATEEWCEESTTLLYRVALILARSIQAYELIALQQRRIRELAGLAEVARTMQSGAEVERLYTGFAAALRQLLAYDHLYIARVDPMGTLLEVPSFDARGRSASPPQVRAADAHHPWFVGRSVMLWRSGDGAPPSFVDPGIRNAAVVPMRPKGQMLGVVVVVLPRLIGLDQMRIVEQAVEQLALALDGAMLYEQATARASHIQALSNLARIVASVVNMREAFAAFAEEVRWLIPFDRAAMFLLNESEQQVETYATYPDESERRGVTDLVTSVARVPLEAGAAVTLSRGDPRAAGLDWSMFGEDAVEVAAVPVRQGNRTSAVFALANRQSGDYGPQQLDALDEVAGLLAVTIERLRLYEHAEYSAKHDLLTGLPNYRYLQERIHGLHAGVDAPGESAVMVADMDNLKAFNDSLGHETGDRVIEIVARELRRACGEQGFVARTGGDEFVVVMEGSGLAAASAVADRIHAALRDAHHEIPGAPARIGVSIGVAVAPSAGAHPAELLQAADSAMYEAKFAGGQQTRAAGDRGGVRAPRDLRTRGAQLAESVIRSVTAGATPAEAVAIGQAQRWIAAVMARLGSPPDALPRVRMLLAQAAAGRLVEPARDRDQVLAHYLISRVRADLESQAEEQLRFRAHALGVLIPAVLDIAWATIQRPEGQGMDAVRAMEAYLHQQLQLSEDPVWPVLAEVVRTSVGRRDAA